MGEGDAEHHRRGSRTGSETRRREFQVGVRLLPEEATLLLLDSENRTAIEGRPVSPGELLRRAYFGESLRPDPEPGLRER